MPLPGAFLADFLAHLEKERDVSPRTVTAYGRDLDEFGRFLADYYGGSSWTWQGVDRLAIRSYMGHLDAARLGQALRCSCTVGGP